MRTECGPGHDEVAIDRQPSQGEVTLDPSSLVAHLGVDHRAHRTVDVVRTHPLEEGAGARASDLQLREARLVEDRHGVPARERLHLDGRTPVFARPPVRTQRIVAEYPMRGEPVRAFPHALLAELATERGQAVVGGGTTQRPTGRPLLVRVVDVVVGGIHLDGSRHGELAACILRPETTDVHLPRVEARLTVENPLAHHSADAAGARDAVRAEPGGDEESVDRALAEHELVVRREAFGAVDQRDDLGGFGGRDPPNRVGHDRREPIPVFGEQLVVEVGRDAVHAPRRGIPFVAAEDEAAGLASEVDEVVRVSELGQFVGDAVDGRGDHVLVGHRNDRNRDPGEQRNVRRVHPAREHHGFRLDASVIGLHRAHAAVDDVESGDADAGLDAHAARLRAADECVGEATGIEVAVGGQPQATEHAGRIHEREQIVGFGRADEFHRQAERLGPAVLARQFLHARRRRGDAQRADFAPAGGAAGLLGLGFEAAVHVDAVHHHARQRQAAPELADESGRVERGTARDLGSFEHEHIGAAGLGEMPGDARTTNSRTDDDHLGAVLHAGASAASCNHVRYAGADALVSRRSNFSSA